MKHKAYFETLGGMEQDSPEWRAVFAGLVVLRLVDAVRQSGAELLRADWAGVYSVREAIDAVGEGNALRATLATVVDELRNGTQSNRPLVSALLSYGRALDYAGRWKLAADVFETVAETAPPRVDPRAAIDANVALGGAARRAGDWDASARGYQRAAHIADTLGDLASSLRVSVGMANTQLARGNLPSAESILDDVIAQAKESYLDDVASLALHTRASVAHGRGQYADAIQLAYEALALTSNDSAREPILADIAASFAEMGMRDAARDAHLILACTSQQKRVRWQATLNLMELASLDGVESAFDSYAAELAGEQMDPRTHAYYLLYMGQGSARFGRIEAAERMIRDAIAYASRERIHQVEMEADAALADLRSTVQSPAEPVEAIRAPYEPGALRDIAQAISGLREMAVPVSPG